MKSYDSAELAVLATKYLESILCYELAATKLFLLLMQFMSATEFLSRNLLSLMSKLMLDRTFSAVCSVMDVLRNFLQHQVEISHCCTSDKRQCAEQVQLRQMAKSPSWNGGRGSSAIS